MGGAFSLNIFGGSFSNNFANLTNNTSQTIDSSCNSGGTQTAAISNFKLNLKNIKCKNVDLITQTVSSNLSCTETSTAKAIQANVSQQIAGATSSGMGAVSGSLNLFGASISTNEVTSTNKVKQAISATCGNENTAAQNFSDVAIDMSGVTCDNLNIVTQKSSVSSQCMLSNYAEAIQSNKALQRNGDMTTTDTWVFVLLGVAFIALVVFIIVMIVHHLHHHRHVKVCHHHASASGPPHVSCSHPSVPGNYHRCAHAVQTGRPAPSDCDPALLPQDHPTAPAARASGATQAALAARSAPQPAPAAPTTQAPVPGSANVIRGGQHVKEALRGTAIHKGVSGFKAAWKQVHPASYEQARAIKHQMRGHASQHLGAGPGQAPRGAAASTASSYDLDASVQKARGHRLAMAAMRASGHQ